MNDRLPKSLFPLIWYFLKPHAKIVFLCASLAFCAGFWGPLNSIIVKYLINLLPTVSNHDVSILWSPLILIVMNFVIFDNFTWRGVNYIWAKYVPIVQNAIIAKMHEYVLAHSHGFYQNTLSGKVSKQITSLVDGITTIITYTAVNFLRGVSLLCASFIASYFAHPIFCLILMIWFAFFATFGMWASKKLVKLSDDLAKREADVVGELVDSLSNQSNVRMFARQKYEGLRMLRFFGAQQSAYTKTYLYSTLLSSIDGALIAIMFAFSGYFLIHLYSKDLVTIGDFALILGLTIETGHMMWQTLSQVDEFNKAVGRCKQSLSTLLVDHEIVDEMDAKTLICKRGAITFERVKFHYKGTEPLFQNKSIEITAGQKVGLVGYSGGGKSTFVNLIMRFYDVTEGTISIDGQDIKAVTQQSLRNNIAMIPQDPSLFNRSLMENIRYGKIDATNDEVVAAAKKAHAHEFISMLAEGYESLVGERGVKLSGGQRQRIAIARAILKNAPILILDEATSQLDSVTETIIQDTFWDLMQNKTTLVIAHRLSTLLHMDRILVFDKGRIVEDGTHKELLAKDGLYTKLWHAQVGGFLGDKGMEDEV